MMEIGKPTSYAQIQQLIQQNDTDITVKAGIVLSGKQGSLAYLREAIQKYMQETGGMLVFWTFTSQPVYVVHYNDLSPQKQQAVGRKGV